jgi:hypothetical protein
MKTRSVGNPIRFVEVGVELDNDSFCSLLNKLKNSWAYFDQSSSWADVCNPFPRYEFYTVSESGASFLRKFVWWYSCSLILLKTGKIRNNFKLTSWFGCNTGYNWNHFDDLTKIIGTSLPHNCTWFVIFLDRIKILIFDMSELEVCCPRVFITSFLFAAPRI